MTRPGHTELMASLIVLFIVVVGPLAVLYGADSRDTHTDLTLR